MPHYYHQCLLTLMVSQVSFLFLFSISLLQLASGLKTPSMPSQWLAKAGAAATASATLSSSDKGSSASAQAGFKANTPVDNCCPRVSILAEIADSPGSLYELLKYFWKYDINLTHIESRPVTGKGCCDVFNVFIDFDGKIGEEKTDSLLKTIRRMTKSLLILDEKEVPWFPHHISELDKLSNRTLDAGAELQADHPGFNDPVYRARREELAAISNSAIYGKPVPQVKYTESETKTWGTVYAKLKSLQDKYACPEYVEIMPLMEKECGYSVNNIPQIEDISRFLKGRTGFQLRPVTGLLSSRDFLSGLAYRMFFSTQYIRHPSKPLYTPEPDICHELLGHAPMFADQDFADFSQEIGLASLGASDEEVKRLATCYWFSVEFGLVKERGGGKGVKAYGAGLLSSFGELEYSCSGKETVGDSCAPQPRPTLLPWDPKVAADTPYPICTYQPTYFVAESLSDAKLKMRDFCEQLHKPFHARMNPLTNSVWVSRAVKTPEPNFEKSTEAKVYYTQNK